MRHLNIFPRSFFSARVSQVCPVSFNRRFELLTFNRLFWTSFILPVPRSSNFTFHVLLKILLYFLNILFYFVDKPSSLIIT